MLHPVDRPYSYSEIHQQPMYKNSGTLTLGTRRVDGQIKFHIPYKPDHRPLYMENYYLFKCKDNVKNFKYAKRGVR